MALHQLTDKAIANMKPPKKEVFVTDGGGLYLRLRPDGSKLWMFRFSVPKNIDAKSPRPKLSIGPYPEIRLAVARDQARDYREKVAQGIDIRQEKAAPVEAEPEPSIPDSNDDDFVPTTVGDLFDVWFKRYVLVNRTSENDQDSIKGRFNNHVRPKIGDEPLATVRGKQLLGALDPIVRAGHKRQANLALSDLNQMFDYAVPREWIQGNPASAIKKKDVGGTDNEGDRVLTPDELVIVQQAMQMKPPQKSRYYVPVRTVVPVRTELAVWLAVSTLARSIEIATMRRSLVHVSRAIWEIPPEIAKNDKGHIIHLSGFALAVVERLLALESDSDYVFAGAEPKTHVSEKTFTRNLTDRQTRAKSVKKRKNTTELDLPGGHWTMHDLRRTGATMMGELGVDPKVIDLCQNHVEENKVKRTYQRQKMLPQRKQAFDMLGAELSRILGGTDWLPNTEPLVLAKAA